MIVNFLYKAVRFAYFRLLKIVNKIICHVILRGNNVIYKDFKTSGSPYIVVASGGILEISENFTMHNGIHGNPIGCFDKCTFVVDKSAHLSFGKNVGISQAAIICHSRITIGDNVKIGGGVKIFDTDFHSLDPKIRASKQDLQHKAKAPVHIKKNAFIGAYSIVLKGVTVGENSIVGAGSVVTKSIPDNQIWGGNPAKFIREIQ